MTDSKQQDILLDGMPFIARLCAYLTYAFFFTFLLFGIAFIAFSIIAWAKKRKSENNVSMRKAKKYSGILSLVSLAVSLGALGVAAISVQIG